MGQVLGDIGPPGPGLACSAFCFRQFFLSVRWLWRPFGCFSSGLTAFSSDTPQCHLRPKAEIWQPKSRQIMSHNSHMCCL